MIPVMSDQMAVFSTIHDSYLSECRRKRMTCEEVMSYDSHLVGIWVAVKEQHNAEKDANAYAEARQGRLIASESQVKFESLADCDQSGEVPATDKNGAIAKYGIVADIWQKLDQNDHAFLERMMNKPKRTVKTWCQFIVV